MKFKIFCLLAFSLLSFQAHAIDTDLCSPESAVQVDVQSLILLQNASLPVTGTSCEIDNMTGTAKLVYVSADQCCFHRTADGTCVHPNPACTGCTCYHRTPTGCVHCSCGPGRCP